MVMNFQAKQQILLTGAGFTHNFGGFLAEQFWAELLNKLSLINHIRIVKLLKQDEGFDFEHVYSLVMNVASYDDDQRKGLQSAVRQCFSEMHEILKAWDSRSHGYRIDRALLDNGFLRRFVGDPYPKNPGFIFTTNQDLFLEMHGGFGAYDNIIPGVSPPNGDRWFLGGGSTSSISLKGADIPSKDAIEARVSKDLGTAGLHYVKLHGSCNWYYPDGLERMILGYGKQQQIQADPLLSSYHQIFREVLCSDNRKLLVIGYGFRDRHINNVLIEAIKDHSLELYVLSPMNPRAFKNYLFSVVSKKQLRAETIWDGIEGYFPYRLAELFPTAERPSRAVAQIIKVLGL